MYIADDIAGGRVVVCTHDHLKAADDISFTLKRIILLYVKKKAKTNRETTATESPIPCFPKEAKVPKGTDLDGHMTGRDVVAKSPSGGFRQRQSTVPGYKLLPINGLVPWLVQRIGGHKA